MHHENFSMNYLSKNRNNKYKNISLKNMPWFWEDMKVENAKYTLMQGKRINDLA